VRTLDTFDRTLDTLTAAGRTPRMVVVCNPHNPLGFCYPRETLVAYLRFAEKHDLHLLVDEVYALSTYENPAVDAQPFTSILAIDARGEAGCDPARVHVVYGMSKDFCAAGLRAGKRNTFISCMFLLNPTCFIYSCTCEPAPSKFS
jgi:1-aminocyclopropane-1-carboxylate synthase